MPAADAARYGLRRSDGARSPCRSSAVVVVGRPADRRAAAREGVHVSPSADRPRPGRTAPSSEDWLASVAASAAAATRAPAGRGGGWGGDGLVARGGVRRVWFVMCGWWRWLLPPTVVVFSFLNLV